MLFVAKHSYQDQYRYIDILFPATMNQKLNTTVALINSPFSWQKNKKDLRPVHKLVNFTNGIVVKCWMYQFPYYNYG